MKKMIMGIGLPGSGKTTFLKPFANENSYVYICPDEIRKELTGSDSDQTKNREVWDLAKIRVKEAFTENKSVVFDATFANEGQRIEFIDFARACGAEKVQGVFFTTPYDISLERNNDRERVVPEYAMERMYGNMKEKLPDTADGFDSVFDLDEFQKLERGELAVDDRDPIVKEFKVR